MMQAHSKKGIAIFLGTSTFVLALAQLSSYLVEARLPEGNSVKVFSFLHMTHIRNLGGIFGVLQGHGWLFTIMSLLVLFGLILFVARMRGLKLYEYACYGLIVGGGLGNILDRLIYGSVIDFIDIRGIAFWKYIFNTADVMIHLGIWPLVIMSFFEAKPEESVPLNVPTEG